MKRKYFVRGLGVGILFGALIMFAAYMTSGKNRMSDEDVIKRAQELGMVKQSEYVLESDVTSQETTTEEITTEATTEKATTEAPTTTEKATTEKTTTEKATTEASTTEKADTSTQTTVTISSGMSSEAIASALANAGLVDDASKFNSFLVANGYDMKLETGNFSLETGMSYEEIAGITKKNAIRFFNLSDQNE